MAGLHGTGFCIILTTGKSSSLQIWKSLFKETIYTPHFTSASSPMPEGTDCLQSVDVSVNKPLFLQGQFQSFTSVAKILQNPVFGSDVVL